MVLLILQGLVLFTLFWSSYGGECPDHYLVTPCKCFNKQEFTTLYPYSSYYYYYNSANYVIPGLFKTMTNDSVIIACASSDFIYQSQLFEQLDDYILEGPKDFDNFLLYNSPTKTIEENVFHNITFKEKIVIYSNPNLKTIHPDAFSESAKVTEQIIIKDNLKLNGKSLFHALNKLSGVKNITIVDNGLTEIPADAFKSQTNLFSLEISESKLAKIGARAFTGLTNLKELYITGKEVSYIPDFCFEMSDTSKYPLYIHLSSNRFETTSFAANAFVNIGRPTLLTINVGRSYYYYSSNSFNTLDKNAFLPFLKDHPMNRIVLKSSYFDCSTCRNYWIKKNNMTDRIYSVTCQNGRELDDPNNFSECQSDTSKK